MEEALGPQGLAISLITYAFIFNVNEVPTTSRALH